MIAAISVVTTSPGFVKICLIESNEEDRGGGGGAFGLLRYTRILLQYGRHPISYGETNVLR